MSGPRKLYEFLMAASMAHAKWDYEVSMSIIKNRKKMLWLLALVTPILAVSALSAADLIGSKTAYAPAHYTTTIFLVSIAVGLAAGLITGCIGAGGGFIITPALMAAGVKGILAVGTDVFHIFAKAIMGTTVHKKLGNVSVRLADGVPRRLRRRDVHRRLDQQDALQQGPAALRGLHQLGLRGAARLPRLLRAGGLLEVAQRQGDRRRARRARRPLGHDRAGREACRRSTSRR